MWVADSGPASARRQYASRVPRAYRLSVTLEHESGSVQARLVKALSLRVALGQAKRWPGLLGETLYFKDG